MKKTLAHLPEQKQARQVKLLQQLTKRICNEKIESFAYPQGHRKQRDFLYAVMFSPAF